MTDILAAAAGVAVCTPLRYSFNQIAVALASPSGLSMAILAAMIWLGAHTYRGSYRPNVLVSRTEQLGCSLSAAGIAWVSVHLLAVWLKITVPFESRLVMAVSLPATLGLVALTRMFIARPLAARVHQRLAHGPVLFVGVPALMHRLAAEFKERNARGRRVAVHRFEEFTPGRAASIVREQEFGEVIMLPETGHVPQALDLAFACLDAGAEVAVLGSELRVIAGRNATDAYDQIPRLRLRRIDYAGPKIFFKRLGDILGAGLGLILLTPLLVTIGCAVRLSSPGPVVYRQERIGYRGRRFRMYKFRTMRDGNDSSGYEEYMRSFIREGVAASVAEDGTKIYKPPRDSRVTRVGAWLRKFSLDELPQLWNVLKGDMSLVGPRPCLLYEWDLYDEWQRRRFDVIPGCTGLWQVAGRSRVQFNEMVMLDLYYAHEGTLFTDLRLIFQTIPVMVLGRGAF